MDKSDPAGDLGRTVNGLVAKEHGRPKPATIYAAASAVRVSRLRFESVLLHHTVVVCGGFFLGQQRNSLRLAAWRQMVGKQRMFGALEG
jgi:hypothetical protein